MPSIHSEEYRQIVSKLTAARKDAGLSQKEVATMLNKPQSYISKIETFQRRIDILEMKELSKIYKIKLSTLVEDK